MSNMTHNDLVAQAKAAPEAFRRETIVALREGYNGTRAMGVEGVLLDSYSSIETALRAPWTWCWSSTYPHRRALEERAKFYNDALLQALSEMTPAEREKLGW